ncbi:energy transducer TonB [Terriglobus albidus]|uniref:energy transducer TonB n=1 Tax=Terriglobus albidus TaxID=1592106 RepID=UPI0021E01A6E|nr:energy transducer TonB [Terriglobus albidus]
MLESALIESTGRIHTARRYTAIASIGFQVLLGAACISYPLLYPEALPKSVMTPLPLQPPMLAKAPLVVAQNTARAVSQTTPTIDRAFTAPPSIPKTIDTTPDPGVAKLGVSDMGMKTPGNTNEVIGGILRDTGPTPSIVSVVPKPKPAAQPVSEGITRGLLLKPITPVYPPIARAAGVHGTVIVTAVISKSGMIESLQVVSGPEMLRGAALDAIRAARYRPYLLNGDPTEVQTTITINFTMGS